MDAFVRILDVIAWPIVALVLVLILGPGGLLVRFADSLGKSLSDFTKSIPELRTTALAMQADVGTLLSKSRELSGGFSIEFQELEKRIDGISTKLGEN